MKFKRHKEFGSQRPLRASASIPQAAVRLTLGSSSILKGHHQRVPRHVQKTLDRYHSQG